jgi:hypothetical protein
MRGLAEFSLKVQLLFMFFIGPTDATGGPTGPTSGPTDPPPGGVATTIVVIQKQTVIGSDLFIVGGVAPDQPVDIELHPFPVQWLKYNLWR